jgi:DNA transposition AAA+ family ATPase
MISLRMNGRDKMNSLAVKSDQDKIFAIYSSYDKGLYERFVTWMNHSGTSLNQAAYKLNRSTKSVSKYLSIDYEGDINVLEKDIRNLLWREEDLKFTTKLEEFRNIRPSREIWEALQFCHDKHKMGAVIAPAGCSKTMTANEFVRRNPGTTLITANIIRRSPGAILAMIAYKNNCTQHGASNAILLDIIVDRVKYSKELIIIDEAHFLSWEAFEAVKTIYDNARTGIVYLGMPRLYSQMKGNKAYLWDQIISRLAIQRSVSVIEKTDIKLIAESIFPGLPKNCIEFLYEKALGPGKLRLMAELLEKAVHVSKTEKIPLSLDLFKEINKCFFLQEIF